MTWLKRILGVLGVATLALVAWWVWDRDAMMAWKEEAGPVAFFGAMAVLPAIGIPVTPLFVLAGATFGVGPGLLGSGVALGLNLALCYAIARSALRPGSSRSSGASTTSCPTSRRGRAAPCGSRCW